MFVFLILLFLTFASPFALATDCGAVLDGNQRLFLSSIKTPLSVQAQHLARELAALRINIDTQSSKGSYAHLSYLEKIYQAKLAETLKALDKDQSPSAESFVALLNFEIEHQQTTGKKFAMEEQAEESIQTKTIEQRNAIGEHAIFHRIEAGSFLMGDPRHPHSQKPVSLTQPFYFMSTTTTQIIWKKIADLANARLHQTVKINSTPSRFKGDTLPVEQVSYEDVQTWIEALNEMSRLGEPAITDVIPDHRPGDVYRLPSDAEWEFVVRGRGQYEDIFYFGNSKEPLLSHAWLGKNSNQTTNPVGQKTPLYIDHMDFYDMYGNVFQWIQDWHKHSLSGGADPKGPEMGETRGVRGSSWRSDPTVDMNNSSRRQGLEPKLRLMGVGFRLAREASR